MKNNEDLRKARLLDLHLKSMAVNNFYTIKSFDNENLFYQQNSDYDEIIAFRVAREIIEKTRKWKR